MVGEDKQEWQNPVDICWSWVMGSWGFTTSSCFAFPIRNTLFKKVNNVSKDQKKILQLGQERTTGSGCPWGSGDTGAAPCPCLHSGLPWQAEMGFSPALLNRKLTAHQGHPNPPAQPSSASVSRSSRPFRFSALMMVGRGARSTSCLSGRIGRVVPSLFSFLGWDTRAKMLKSCQVHRWKQSRMHFQE